MAVALGGITFHEKLGSQKERVERVAELAFQIAGAVDADPEDARRAAQLAKADLVSGMVGEFPELQGLMGRYYAEAGGIKPEIARAIELHYKPKGPTDTVPKASDGDAVAIAVALADKLDTLVGFWAIGEKPTGSGDPYQLRRAALGVIRIVLENDLRLPLMRVAEPTQIMLARLSERSQSLRDGIAELRERRKIDLTQCELPREVLERRSGSSTRSCRCSRRDRRPPLLLRRPAQGAPAREGGAARPDRRGVLARRPGRPGADRQARRGAGRVPEERRRRQPADRRAPRHQHPARRGEEGQEELRRRRRCRRCCASRRRRRCTPPSRR